MPKNWGKWDSIAATTSIVGNKSFYQYSIKSLIIFDKIYIKAQSKPYKHIHYLISKQMWRKNWLKWARTNLSIKSINIQSNPLLFLFFVTHQTSRTFDIWFALSGKNLSLDIQSNLFAVSFNWTFIFSLSSVWPF